MTEKNAKRELIRRATKLRPVIHIGKNGLNKGIFDEIISQLKNSRIIKVKVLLNSNSDSKHIAADLKQVTGSIVVDVRGGIITITDKRTWISLSQKKLR